MQPRCPFLKFREINNEVQDICSEMSGHPCILELYPGATCCIYNDWLDDQYAKWQAEHKKEESVCSSLDEQRKNL